MSESTASGTSRPWRSAEAGEAWLLVLDDWNYQAVVVTNNEEFLFRDGGTCKRDARFITNAERLWPEMQRLSSRRPSEGHSRGHQPDRGDSHGPR